MVSVSVGTCLENPARVTNHPGDHASHLKRHWGLKVVFCHEMLQQRCEVHNHLLTPGTWTSSLHDSKLGWLSAPCVFSEVPQTDRFPLWISASFLQLRTAGLPAWTHWFLSGHGVTSEGFNPSGVSGPASL